MVGYSKDFGYLLQENNVIGGVVNGVDQIYGVMIMSDSLNMMTVLPQKFRGKPVTTLSSIPAQGSMKKEYNFPRKVSVLNYNHLNLHERTQRCRKKKWNVKCVTNTIRQKRLV